jgi:hypothetical protein
MVVVVGVENPTYLKQPGDKLVVTVAIGGLTVGVLCILKGLFDMSLGRNKLPM